MCRMRVVAQRIEEQNVQVCELFPAFCGYVAVIGQIGAIAETESVDDAFAMKSANGLKIDAGKPDRLLFKAVEGEAGAAGLSRRRIEDVFEGALDHVQRRG